MVLLENIQHEYTFWVHRFLNASYFNSRVFLIGQQINVYYTQHIIFFINDSEIVIRSSAKKMMCVNFNRSELVCDYSLRKSSSMFFIY